MCKTFQIPIKFAGLELWKEQSYKVKWIPSMFSFWQYLRYYFIIRNRTVNWRETEHTGCRRVRRQNGLDWSAARRSELLSYWLHCQVNKGQGQQCFVNPIHFIHCGEIIEIWKANSLWQWPVWLGFQSGENIHFMKIQRTSCPCESFSKGFHVKFIWVYVA